MRYMKKKIDYMYFYKGKRHGELIRVTTQGKFLEEVFRDLKENNYLDEDTTLEDFKLTIHIDSNDVVDIITEMYGCDLVEFDYFGEGILFIVKEIKEGE